MIRKVAVTGAARGIGRAVAERLAKDGYCVIALDRERELLTEAFDGRDEFQAHSLDLNDEGAVGAVLADADGLYGLVNIAGTTRYGGFKQTSREFLDQVFAENAGLTLTVCRAAVPVLRAQGGGRIVNMGSAAAVATVTGFMAYAMAKAAIIAFTRQLAVELAPQGITVNALAPGPVETEMLGQNQNQPIRNRLLRGIPAGRYASPQEIADATAFLVGADAGFVTGQVFAVDGGMALAPVVMHDLLDG